MAPLQYFSFRQVLVLYLVLFLFASTLVCACSDSQSQRTVRFLGRRRLLDIEKEEQLIKKKPSSSLSTKNQTKPVKQSAAAAEKEDQPKKKVDIGTSYTKKNQTKLLKPSTNSTKTSSSTLDKSQIKKLNSTSKSLISTKTTTSTPPKIQLKKLNSTSKASNSTKPSSVASKKSPDLSKPSTPKEKTTKPVTIKPSKPQTADKLPVLESKSKNSDTEKKEKPKQQKPQKPPQPSWVDQEEDADFVTELRDLPAKFQQTLMPDLERISTTSRAYIFKANKEITRGFKPIVGNKYAPTIAPVISFAFILLPLLLVSLIFNQIKAYLSLQKILIFIQVYLSIYFSILCLSSLVTGLEPLKFFYATSQSTYIWLQVLQTLAYVLYLLLLLMYLILVFSTDCSLGSKLLGLLQTFVGFAVGLHYYVTVFHRVVLHQPPRTNWKVHGVYATCFLVICLFSRAERRKKAYLAEGGEEGKLS